MILLEHPSLDDVEQRLREVILWRRLAIIVGFFSVDYYGRASSYLESGERLIIIKEDGSVLIHRSVGYKPINWQPSSSRIRMERKDGILILEVIRMKPREVLRIKLERVKLLYIDKLVDTGAFEMYLTEEDMKRIFIRNPGLIEPGLHIITSEKEVGSGKADIVARDSSSNIVIIELKKHKIGVNEVLQLNKYVSELRVTNKNVRGIIIGTDISSDAMELAKRLKLEYKVYSLRALSQYKRK